MSEDADFTSLTPDFYTSAEVCKKADIGRTGLHHIIRNDPSFPRPHRFSNRILLHRAQAVDEWLSTYKKHQPRSKR